MSAAIALKKNARPLFAHQLFIVGRFAKCPNCGSRIKYTRPGKGERGRAFCNNCQLIFET